MACTTSKLECPPPPGPETETNGGDIQSTESKESFPCPEETFSPELHAICLLAIFHSNFVCRICNEVVIDCVCLACGHNFCSSCLQNSVSAIGDTCPTCGHRFVNGLPIQRTFCVDEFLSEMYEHVLEFAQALFGRPACSPCAGTRIRDANRRRFKALANEFRSQAHSSASAGQFRHYCANSLSSTHRGKRHGSLGLPEIMNFTSGEARQNIKAMRRAHDAQKYPPRNKSDYSILEHQRELFSVNDTINMTAVVQFFLSAITAYVTYEIGDMVDSDAFILAVVSVILWTVIFMGIMRSLGYEGTMWNLLSALSFIHISVPETDDPVSSESNRREGIAASHTIDSFTSTSTESGTSSSFRSLPLVQREL